MIVDLTTITNCGLRLRYAATANMLVVWPLGSAAGAQENGTAGVAPAVPPPLMPTFGSADLPRDLSPWSMFVHADVIVQGVMLGLALASVVTWTVWLAKSIELFIAKRRLAAALDAISSGSSLAEVYQRVGQSSGLVATMIDAAAAELRLSQGLVAREGVKERVASRLHRLESAAARRMARGTGVLATIGSTAPFIGLFGTVWGIMNSFISISKSQTTNLAVVAPGIAEALLATAMGLVAAIPAVIIYNVFARSISAYKYRIADAGAEVMRIVSRDLDRNTHIEIARAAE